MKYLTLKKKIERKKTLEATVNMRTADTKRFANFFTTL